MPLPGTTVPPPTTYTAPPLLLFEDWHYVATSDLDVIHDTMQFFGMWKNVTLNLGLRKITRSS